ncbi:MAG TPA: 30S ribosomal protein S6 [Bacteroidales bacterium]|jgi:small subunit ribosomal protein S6|nr:30S ribosomal protein S6 [Bacteroidales bacterium]
MLRQYETVFILTPVLSDVQMKEAVAKYRDLILAGEGEIVYEEDWGLKKLAYPIQKKSTGFYHLIGFKATPDFVARLELQYRRDERVIRFLTFAMDKHAIAYAEKRNTKSKDPVPVKEEKPAPKVKKPDLDDDIDIDEED